MRRSKFQRPIFISICGALALAAGVANGQIPTPAKSRVEIEIAVDPGLQANVASQRWAKTLGDMGLDGVRFRPLKNGDRPEVKQQGAGSAALIQITAQLNNRGALVTSGGQFAPSDNAKLKKWLADLQAGGAVPGERKTVFGLTAEQFAAAKKTLSTPISFSTKDMRPEKAIAQFKPLLALPLVIDPAFERAVIADDPLRDELQGLSAGTALAAIARPAGGVLLPRPTGKEVQLALTSPQSGGEMWPIGWPPEEKDEQKLVPALYEFIPVEIDGVPAGEAITALQGRINVPMLFDHNNMVRQRIDLKKPVKVPPGKRYYRQIFERVLNQAGLRSEVRVDDAGKPLIWVTTL